jgi:glycosyltransferase involved in cell wall biosynthesis
MWAPDTRNDSPLVSPLVSIVTPSFNAARFIEQTIESVLAQGYPRIEYIVMDAGSTDGTLDILRRYESPKLTWISEPDGGAADAINRGLARSHGDVLAFINADDVYAPGAVATAVRAFEDHTEAAVIYGSGIWIDEEGKTIGPYPVRDFESERLARECFLCQPASFIRREAFENVGGLDPKLQLTFDYELWMRLARTYKFHRIDDVLALSRMHQSNKSLGQRQEVFKETFTILQRHYGYIPFEWIYSYLCYCADGRDQFFEALQPSIVRYLQSLPAGLWMNRSSMGKYFVEWFRVMSAAGLRRRIAG